ncbi:hypothetical protein [Cohnella cellulosilytica]|uniref:Uncharacterized protein n=1 Tax=Cohnella cellulosilytica TaxID=986710 RepID=A0ABW2FFU9_9BACL
MFNTTKRTKLAAGALAAAMLFSLPVAQAFGSAGKPAGAKYQAYQLEATPTKHVSYYKAGAALPETIDWVTAKEDLTFLPTAVTGDVTSALKDADGVYWIGTTNGLQRVNFKEKDARDIVQYMAGPRYLYGGDDVVTGLASDGKGGVWVRTASGVTHIELRVKTIYEKTHVYEMLNDAVQDRRGMVTGTEYTFTPNPGETGIDFDKGTFTSNPKTDDNDGLWTAMYAIGEIFRYQTLKTEGAKQSEIDAAKADAIRATKAVLLLDYVSGRGNGFPARSYMLTSENAAQTSTGDDYGYQSQNGFWFHHRVSVTDAVYAASNPIIPTMQRSDGAQPIGYSIVRVTKDAMSKKGDTLFPSGGTNVMNYNGLGLSQEAIDELNAVRPAGQKLGSDIKTRVDTVDGVDVYQVMPVITAQTNNNKAGEDTSTSASNPPLFQLTVPVYEQIPTFFNDLFPASAIGPDNYIDMNQIVYKADTSSDEVAGHSALFFTAYKYLCDDTSDPQLAELKNYVTEAAHRMADLILKNDNYYIEDATGKSTQWSRWLAKYFNDGRGAMESQPQWASKVGVDANGDDALSYGFEDGPLNALQLMAFLKTASYVTAEAYPLDSARYQTAYDQAFEPEYSKAEPYANGKGYIHLAQEYIERRLIRQATNAYNVLDNEIVTRDNYRHTGDEQEDSNINATLHNDWTQYINYSDEELGWFPVYQLILLEQNPARRAEIVAAYDQWYENEVREENPFYTFLYQLAHPEDKTVDIASAVRYMYRMPEYLISVPAQYNRQDVFFIENGDRDKKDKQVNYALPTDERRVMKNNGNPFRTDNGAYSVDPNYNYTYKTMESGTIVTLPYWLGRYFGIIEEAR